MGLFQVDASLMGPTGRRTAISLLVDTGATFVVIPQMVADTLELHPTRVCPLQLAGGRREEWPLAEVRLRLADLEVTTPCLIGPDGPALLGAAEEPDVRSCST